MKRYSMLYRSLILMIAILFLHKAMADDEFFYIKPSAFSVETFLSFNEDDKALYLLGLGDGLNLAPFFKADEEIYIKYRECFKGMTGADRVDTVVDYLDKNTNEKSESIHIIAFKAYAEMCYEKYEILKAEKIKQNDAAVEKLKQESLNN